MFAVRMMIARFAQLFRLMTRGRTCTHADRLVDAFDMPIAVSVLKSQIVINLSL